MYRIDAGAVAQLDVWSPPAPSASKVAYPSRRKRIACAALVIAFIVTNAFVVHAMLGAGARGANLAVAQQQTQLDLNEHRVELSGLWSREASAAARLHQLTAKRDLLVAKTASVGAATAVGSQPQQESAHAGRRAGSPHRARSASAWRRCIGR